MSDLKHLQNGSDVRGIALEGVEGEHINLTPEIANRIAQAFAVWLEKKLEKETSHEPGLSVKHTLRIGVGHDSRVTARSLTQAASAGMKAAGHEVFDCGLVSTPSMFMTTVFPQTRFHGAIMITASHLPFNRNGMKFFDKDGGLESSDIKEILTIADTLEPLSMDQPQAKAMDAIGLYCAHLRGKIAEGTGIAEHDKPLSGLHIVVDAGNGAGGFFVEKVLTPLGADTEGSQFLDPDGMFPNHIPNPENRDAMAAIQKAVLDHHADLGIIFDTDVDRMSAVLPDGREVNRDAIIAMMAAILADQYPGGTIVTDSVTSDRLGEFLKNKLGLKQHRFKRGYKNVINESKRLNAQGISSPLAIETSGHGALIENYFLDDGAYMAVKLIAALAKSAKEGKTLESYIEDFKDEFESREYRLKIRAEQFKEYGQQVLKGFEEYAKQEQVHGDQGVCVVPDSYEGVRLAFDSKEIQGWALLRLSLHDPLMPLNMEGYREGDCDRMADWIREALKQYIELETIG